jgi:subtilisin family serine protease
MRRLVIAAVTALAALSAGPAAAAVQPNDPAWPSQWAQRQVGMPQIWEVTTGDPSIVIATVDTGINPIPELADALVPGWDFVENDGTPQDTHGHGTRVASVIAARGNNGAGLAGHCWGCRLMPVRVTQGEAVTPERIAQGILWAVDHGARIVNVSLTRLGAAHPAEELAVRYAQDRGVLVIASAGNIGGETRQYPAGYPGVLSVGATDDTDTLYFWSTRGPWVALTAPGCHVVTDATTAPGTICGTSFTPGAVAGVAGLLLSRNPSLTVQQVRDVLLATAKPVPGIGYGRVDPIAAFTRLGLLTAPPAAAPAAAPAPSPSASPVTRVTAKPKPGQRFAREVQIETGTFRRGFKTTFRVGRGRFEMQFATAYARECTLSLRSPDELIVASPAVKNLLSLSAPVPAGRYTAEVRCRGARSRQFSLGVIAMFPRIAP